MAVDGQFPLSAVSEAGRRGPTTPREEKLGSSLMDEAST